MDRTDPDSAAGRREFDALAPPASGVLRTPSSERSARILSPPLRQSQAPGLSPASDIANLHFENWPLKCPKEGTRVETPRRRGQQAGSRTSEGPAFRFLTFLSPLLLLPFSLRPCVSTRDIVLFSAEGFLRRKARTDPDSVATSKDRRCTAGRREFTALRPPAKGVLRTPALMESGQSLGGSEMCRSEPDFTIDAISMASPPPERT